MNIIETTRTYATDKRIFSGYRSEAKLSEEETQYVSVSRALGVAFKYTEDPESRGIIREIIIKIHESPEYVSANNKYFLKFFGEVWKNKFLNNQNG